MLDEKIYLEVCRNPFFVGGTAVLGVIAGVFGSLYTSEIKSSFPFYWGKGPISWEAASFWLLILVFLFMFLSTQWAQNRVTDRAQKELIQKSDQLEGLIRTMPPEGFLAKFDKLYQNSFETALLVSSNGATSENVEEAIRIVLDCIVSLAHYFDGSPQNVRYSANIMLFQSCLNLAAEEQKGLRSRLKFSEEDTELSSLKGVLDLQIHLSTTTATKPSPDDQLVEFAMPVPKTSEKVVNGNKRYRVLPGAPEAFEFKRLAGFHDIAMLEKWCHEKGDFSPGIIEDILAYFRTGAGQNIKSFCSVPLAHSDENEPIGVLNIHRDAVDMLKQKGAVLFIPLTTPFRLLLVDLIRLRAMLET